MPSVNHLFRIATIFRRIDIELLRAPRRLRAPPTWTVVKGNVPPKMAAFTDRVLILHLSVEMLLSNRCSNRFLLLIHHREVYFFISMLTMILLYLINRLINIWSVLKNMEDISYTKNRFIAMSLDYFTRKYRSIFKPIVLNVKYP